MIPSCMQLRSAPKSLKAMTSNSKSLLMTFLTLECNFWKLILLMVSKNFLSWTMSLIGLSVSPSKGFYDEVPCSLSWWRVFSKCSNLWLWLALRLARLSLRDWTSDLVSLISCWRSLTVNFFLGLVLKNLGLTSGFWTSGLGVLAESSWGSWQTMVLILFRGYLLKIDLHPSVALLDLVYLSPDPGEI